MSEIIAQKTEMPGDCIEFAPRKCELRSLTREPLRPEGYHGATADGDAAAGFAVTRAKYSQGVVLG
jgi:hypothetical protein